jgi:AAA ATPase-like protein
VSAEELVGAFATAHPEAAALAEVVSFAVLVDRPLLRQARVRLVPEADAGAEADLWLGPLIKSRSRDGISFTPEIANVLRTRLASNPQRSNDAWQLTRELHAHLPPTTKLEETINCLSVDESEEAAHRIDELLSSVLAAMAAGGRDGLASWAARALENFPTSVRRRSAARMLAAGASLRLGVDPRASLGGDMPEWLRFIAPAHLETATVGVQLAPRLLRVDATASPAGPLLRLPATRPLLLDVMWTPDDGQPEGRQLALRPGDVQHLEVGADDVQLRTVSGDVYELRLGGTAPVEVRPYIIDFSEVINRLGSNYVDQGIEFSKPSITVVTGPPGAGKTSTLAHLVRQLSQQGTFCAHHFFDAGTPKLEYWDYAERSLIAQFMTRYDIPSLAMTMRLHEFLKTFAGAVGTGPVYIVLDNVDVVHLGSVTNVLWPLLDLPPQFRLIASSTASEDLSSILRRVQLQPPSPSIVSAYIGTTSPPPATFGALEFIAEGGSLQDGTSLYIDALAVARAPLPLADAVRLRTNLGVVKGDAPWAVERMHMGEPSVTIRNEFVRQHILSRLDAEQKSAAHRQLVTAVIGDLSPEQRTWYGIRHGCWHWLEATGPGTVQRIVQPARELRRAVELFGARVTVDIIEELDRGGS